MKNLQNNLLTIFFAKTGILSVLFIFTSLFFSVGCKKDQDALTNPKIIKYETKAVKARTGWGNKYNLLGRLEENNYKASLIKYDQNGKIIENNEYDFDGSIISRILSKYDQNENLMETDSYNSTGIIYRNIFKYNQSGKISEEEVYFSNEEIPSKYIYNYDENGKLIGKIGYDPDGFNSVEYSFKYDQKGKLIEEEQYIPRSNSFYKVTHKYDQTGNPIEDIYDAGGYIYNANTYKYDLNGNQFESTYCNSHGNVKYRSSSKYDPSGKITEQFIYDFYSNIPLSYLKYTYEYY